MHTVKLSQLVQQLLAKGYSPRDVRLSLASRGVAWGYKYDRTKAGVRERIRNLRRIGKQLCECGNAYDLEIASELCPACLVEKFTGQRPHPADV